MTATIEDRLARMDTAWQQTEAAGGVGLPPDGVYQARVDRFDFEESNYSGHLQLKTEMVIASGEHQGRTVSCWHDLEDPERLKWAKGHLANLGIPVQTLSGLKARLSDALDAVVEIRIKSDQKRTQNGETKTYTNVFVNKVIAGPPEGAAMSAAPTKGADDDEAPF